MYVRPISTRFSRGRSTPEIRAIRSALPLLVFWIALADHASDTAAHDHLAVLANRLDARSNLHGNSSRNMLWRPDLGRADKLSLGGPLTQGSDRRVPTCRLSGNQPFLRPALALT